MPQDIHLLRGSPPVRSWSKYQSTVPDWTLCGINRKQNDHPPLAVEDAAEVTCKYCQMLMRPSRKTQTARGQSPQERKATAS